MAPQHEGMSASAGEQRASELIRIASHDLRAPLATIQLFIQRLEHQGRMGVGPSAPQWAEGLSGISRAARHALRLIDDLLDTRLLEGHQPIVVGPPPTVDAEEVIAEAIALEREALDQAKCAVTVTRKAGLPGARGAWNRGCLLRIFTNLLHNASRYAPQAPIVVQLARAGERLRIVFTDRGPGLPRAAGADVGKYLDDGLAPTGVHGLGLWIVRRGVAELQGTMKIRNAPGLGLAFAIELPGLALS
jgi:signal transduction histidine kinase